MKELFTRQSAIDAAYLLDEGSCTAQFEFGEPFVVEVDQTITGAEEMLLNISGAKIENRQYGIVVDPLLVRSTLPRGKIREQLGNFDLGFAQNQFTSGLLKFATATLVTARQMMTPQETRHERRALALAEASLGLSRFAKKVGATELLAAVNKIGSNPFFELGATLRRERIFTTLKPRNTGMDRLTQKVPANFTLCREGEAARAMYVLLQGSIAVLQGGRLVAHINESGEAFGEMGLFLEGTRTATLVTETDCALYKIGESDLPLFHSSHRDVFFNIGATLAARLQVTLENTSRILKPHAAGKSTYDQETVRAGDQLCEELARDLRKQLVNIKQPEFCRICDAFFAAIK